MYMNGWYAIIGRIAPNTVVASQNQQNRKLPWYIEHTYKIHLKSFRSEFMRYDTIS